MKARLTVTALALALASIAGTAVAKTPANKSQYEADRAFCSSAQARSVLYGLTARDNKTPKSFFR